MANYYATTRSNYFRIKDKEAFLTFCSDLSLEHWTDTFPEHPGDTFYAVSADTGDCCGWPSMYYDQEQEDMVEIDFADALAQFIDPRDVAILFEVGSEKLRYITGYATAINSEGKHTTLSLKQIYDNAEAMFPGLTVREAMF